MDIGIDRVDDVQNPDQADQQDQPPGQHIDLGRALLHLTVCLLIGNRRGARHPLAKLLQRRVKGLPVRVCIQRRPQLRIGICASQLRIEPVAGQYLDAVDKAAVPHAEIAVIPA